MLGKSNVDRSSRCSSTRASPPRWSAASRFFRPASPSGKNASRHDDSIGALTPSCRDKESKSSPFNNRTTASIFFHTDQRPFLSRDPRILASHRTHLRPLLWSKCVSTESLYRGRPTIRDWAPGHHGAFLLCIIPGLSRFLLSKGIRRHKRVNTVQCAASAVYTVFNPSMILTAPSGE